MTNLNIKNISHDSVFNLIRTITPVEELRFSMHIPSGVAGGLSMLENSILVTLLKYYNPKNIFEFGTFLGATSALLAINSSDQTNITTLDLEAENILVNDFENLDLTYKSDNDNYLRKIYQQRGTPYINNLSAEVKSRVNQIYGDSKALNVDSFDFENKFDLIFIDGGHDLDIVSSDTENSQKMLKADGLIIWHDYKSGVHTDVTDYLDKHCSLKDIYHVQHTMLAIYPTGKYKKIFADLV